MDNHSFRYYILGVVGYAFVINTCIFWIFYKNVLIFKDILRIPKRFVMRFFMSREDYAKKDLQEIKKLKDFLKNLDLTSSQKSSLMWNIDSMEREAIKILSHEIQESLLKKLRSDE